MTHKGYIEPPVALEEKIIHTLYARIEKRHRTMRWSMIGIMGISLTTCVYGIIQTIIGFSSSSFYYYTTLMRTDSGTLLLLWKEFALSLAESFPVVEVGLICITFCLFLVAVRNIYIEPRYTSLQTI